MRRSFLTAALAGAALSSAAQAGITSVTAETKVVRTFINSVDTINGNLITGNAGSAALGSGASYESTTLIDPTYIYFKNGNATAGSHVTVDSFSRVTIGLRNTGSTAVRPLLDSTILPAGMGLYVGPNCLSSVASCGPDEPLPIRDSIPFTAFSSSLPSGIPIAGSSFDFVVRNGGSVLYQLSGSIDFLRNPVTGQRSMVTNLGAAQQALNNFRLVSLPGSTEELSFLWDATPISLLFADTLQPGDESFLTYETRVVSYNYGTCIVAGQVCVTSYAAFGDPVGKGSSDPTFNLAPLDAASAMSQLVPIVASSSAPAGLKFGQFKFLLPTFENGILTYKLEAAAVPEPQSWAMLIVGFGLLGGSLRRRRAAAA